MACKRSLKSFAVLQASWDGLVWSPPIASQKMLPSEPSKAALDRLLCLQLQSQLQTSPVSPVNILDLFQPELNAAPVIQLGQLLPPGHAWKQTCDVCVCFCLHVSRKSGGIWEKDFLPLHSGVFCLQHRCHSNRHDNCKWQFGFFLARHSAVVTLITSFL